MKKFLILLLISPITFAEVYDFVCVSVDGKRSDTEIIIDTNKKYIQLGGIKFATKYKDNKSEISAWYQNSEDLITFKKVSGKVDYVGGLGEDVFWYEYSCRPAERLIP